MLAPLNQTQWGPAPPLPSRRADLAAAYRRPLWRTQEYYRTFSRVNGGRAVESDLFEGRR